MAPFLLQSLLFVAMASLAVVAKQPPSTGKDWMSLSHTMEFQPAAANDGTSERALRQAQSRLLAEQGGQQLSYVDSTETYYDGWAQAWRYVGFYTDCNPAQEERRRRRRRLEEAEEADDAQEAEEAEEEEEEEEEDEQSACTRYLLWAAVSDLC